MAPDALGQLEVWLVTGSQELYGPATLRQVEAHAREVAAGLDAQPDVPVRVVHREVATSPGSIRRVALEANAADTCIGVIAWMHTFSPAKMWIAGLSALQKPLLHLHTQFNRELPWAEIDMDFMNLNQSAHGDREFGFLETRMRSAPEDGRRSLARPGGRGARGRLGARGRRLARGAVAPGRPLRRQHARGRGHRGRQGRGADSARASPSTATAWTFSRTRSRPFPTRRSTVSSRSTRRRTSSLRLCAPAARAASRCGTRRASRPVCASFLDAGGFRAFTDTFENLGRLTQLPGIAAQRLMADGYGFGAEGDWKTAALVRIAKVMSAGLDGGTSFMEDYTYDLAPSGAKVLGAHMLEVCPSIAAKRPSCEIHPLSIGGRADPVRLVFTAAPGPAVVAAMLDLGDRFRFVLNEVEVVEPDEDLPAPAGGAGGVEAEAGLRDRRRGVASRRRPTPQRPVPGDRQRGVRRTSRRSPGSSCSSSTTRPGSETSPTSSAGTRRTTGSPEGCSASTHELRERVLEANMALGRAGLVVLTFGNASAVDRDASVVAIKPSGVSYDRLTSAEIAVVDIESGAVVDGRMRPSSDTPTHLVLYRAWLDVGGIVHTHSSFATAWAQAGEEIPCYGTTHADHFDGAVPVTRRSPPRRSKASTSGRRGR